MIDTITMVMTLAIIDSLDPCLFALFVSIMTSAASADVRALARMSASFISGVFCYYTLLGLLLRAALSQIAIDPEIFGALLMMYGSLMIFHGAMSLRRGEEPAVCRREDITCRLAGALKLYETRVGGAATAFLIGFIAAAALLPCTAGMYVVYNYLLRDSGFVIWMVLTMLYNVIFVLPLLLISLLLITSTKVPEIYWIVSSKRDHIKIVGGFLGVLIALYIIYTY